MVQGRIGKCWPIRPFSAIENNRFTLPGDPFRATDFAGIQ
jgi:hypothetical protein